MDEQKQTYLFDEAFQRMIVASAIKDPVFLLQCRDVLLPGYFDYDYLSSIMRIARDIFDKHKSVPSKVVLVEEIKSYCQRFHVPQHDRDLILTELESIYEIDIADKSIIIDHVTKFGQRQALRNAIMKIVGLLNASGNMDNYEEARNIMNSALNVGMNLNDMGMSLYPNLLNIPAMAEKSASGLTRKVPTIFFPIIDSKTNGGPGRCELWFVMGLPGTGKSAFLINLGVATLQNGGAVFHYTIGDLNKIDVAIRYAQRLTFCTQKEVVNGSERYLIKARKLSEYDNHLHIKYFSSGTATMGHLRSHASKLMALEGIRPTLIIIDYPEELKPSSDSSYESGGDSYSQMRAMADEFECLVWCASQPHRWKPKSEQGPKNNRSMPNELEVLRMGDVADSWKKPMKADGIVTWNMTSEEEMAGIARLWVEKTRRQQSHYMVYCSVDLDRMIIRQSEEQFDYKGTEKYHEFVVRKLQESVDSLA